MGLWRVLPHIFIQNSLEVSCIILNPISKGKKPKNYFPLLKARIRRLSSLNFPPIRIYLKLSKQVVEFTSVDAVSKFLLVQNHRATVEAFEDLIPKISVLGCIDNDATNWRIKYFFLLRLW